MYREANSQQLSKQEILSFSTHFGCSRQLHRNPPGSEYTLPGVSVFSECQAAGSIKFCADGGSSDKTRTRRRFVRKSSPHCRSTNRRSEEHTSELQSQSNLVCRLLLE